MMTVTVERIELRQDRRGFVFEPMTTSGLKDQRNTHVVITEPGCVRGNHYHLRATETLAVFGSWLVRYREAGTMKELRFGEREPARITIPPGIPHAFQNTGNGAAILTVFSDLSRQELLNDTVPDVLIEP
jgi:UDP-2-acetamido-2,6-beta-L-arabino-hexul-4-ose reductase